MCQMRSSGEARQGRASETLYRRRLPHANQFVYGVVMLSHSSRSRARAIQLPMPWSTAKRRKGFSHFIHGLLEGRIIREEPDCLQAADQSASRHVVTRHTQLDGLMRITCPAHDHFRAACARIHCRTPAARASFHALCVALWTHWCHNSPGARRYPQIRRIILFCADCRNLNSSTLGVHACVPYSTQLPTEESNMRNRFFLDVA